MYVHLRSSPDGVAAPSRGIHHCQATSPHLWHTPCGRLYTMVTMLRDFRRLYIIHGVRLIGGVSTQR